MKMKAVLTTLLLALYLAAFGQSTPIQTDSMRLEKFRVEIGLDLSVPDFDTRTIDATVMGTRLAGILEYIMDNFNQSVYNRKLCQVLREQVEPLEHLEFQIWKIQFNKAVKSGADISLKFIVWPEKNAAKVKQTELVFHFKDGVSVSQATNELFSMMSHYVQAIEQLQK